MAIINNNEFGKFIVRIAREAGKIIKAKFQKVEHIKFKDGCGDPVTEADLASETYIISRIKKKFPRHGILSEEKGIDGYKRSDYLLFMDNRSIGRNSQFYGRNTDLLRFYRARASGQNYIRRDL